MTNRQDLVSTLLQGDFDQLRLLWCDNANVIRTKTIFLPTMVEHLRDSEDPASILHSIEHAVTISAALQSLPVTHDEPAHDAGLAPVEDIRLVPDWDTLTVSPSAPHIAHVMTNMIKGDIPWVHCPRHFLQRMEQALAAQGLAIEAGFEVEFYLLQPGAEPGTMPLPFDQTVYGSSVAAHKSHKVISDILRSLWVQGVPVEQYSPEAGPGQHEITLEHCPPTCLADRLIRARETIRAVAESHGLMASFVPVLFEKAAGTGLHVHMSLWKHGRNALADPSQQWGLSNLGNAFMAGMLSHLPALMAVTTPTVNSYRRIRPHYWTGAYQAWGIANKEAAIRLITDAKSGDAIHFELKTIDASSNPYIALAALIAAGLDGIEKNLRLPEPAEIDPADYSRSEREELGIQILPTSLEASLDYFVANEALRQAMKPEFADVFAAVRRAELAGLSGLSFDDERRLLLERY